MSFAAGAVLTVAAIIVPIYSQVETLSKPVTLFETILGDLEQAYVDPVDTDKLFETGMAAMLRYVIPMVSFGRRLLPFSKSEYWHANPNLSIETHSCFGNASLLSLFIVSLA